MRKGDMSSRSATGIDHMKRSLLHVCRVQELLRQLHENRCCWTCGRFSTGGKCICASFFLFLFYALGHSAARWSPTMTWGASFQMSASVIAVFSPAGVSTDRDGDRKHKPTEETKARRTSTILTLRSQEEVGVRPPRLEECCPGRCH